MMLDGPSKEALRDCPTQIARREYLELDGNPYGLDEVLKMVSAFNALDGKELPSSSSKGGKVTVFKNQRNLSKISATHPGLGGSPGAHLPPHKLRLLVAAGGPQGNIRARRRPDMGIQLLLQL